MADNNSVILTLGYTGTDFTRQLRIDNVATNDLTSVKAKALALNASISGGTDDGLSDFFVSDDYDASDPENVIGRLKGIVAAQYEQTNVTEIPV